MSTRKIMVRVTNTKCCFRKPVQTYYYRSKRYLSYHILGETVSQLDIICYPKTLSTRKELYLCELLDVHQYRDPQLYKVKRMRDLIVLP